MGRKRSIDQGAVLDAAERVVARDGAARLTLDNAYVDDDTVNCALAVLYCDGTLGPGDLKQYPAPAGASETAAFAMNMVALSELSDKFEEHGQILVERAINIGRGGNGQADSVQPANDTA